VEDALGRRRQLLKHLLKYYRLPPCPTSPPHRAAAAAQRQIIELLVTAGWYHVISYVCNGLRVEREEWAAQFPAPGAGTST
jgi:hypothetical protein